MVETPGNSLRKSIFTCITVISILLLTTPPGVSSHPAPDTPPPIMPEPLPQWSPPRGIVEENQIVAYDRQTGETRVLEEEEIGDLPLVAFMEGHPGPQGSQPEGQFGAQAFSSLVYIGATDSWPWSAHVKLIRTFPTGVQSECSGVLIDAYHVLTAGHCVWTFTSGRCTSPATACWASSIRVIPGYDNGEIPLEEANFATLYSWTHWTADHNYDWDMGLIELNRPLGALAGWYGYGYNNDNNYFTSNTFRNTGYPADNPYDGESMYSWLGTFDTINTDILYHNNLSYGGQSGGGTYHNTQNIVYGVLSHGHDSVPETGHTRITSQKFTDIQNWINGNTPSQADLQPVFVSVSPTTYDRGDAISSIDYMIHNYASASWSGTITVKVYLSSNDTVSAYDTEIGNHTYTGSLNAKASEWVHVNTAGLIPSNLCGAYPWSNYWIGVILNVNDANDSNDDSSSLDAAQVKINACDIYEPDDTSGQAKTINNGTSQIHDIIPATDVDWTRFTLLQKSAVTLETSGSSGDTRMWLYNSGLSQIDYDDDDGTGTFSYIHSPCGHSALPAGTYYVKVEEYGKNDKIEDYHISFFANPCRESFLPMVLRAY